MAGVGQSSPLSHCWKTGTTDVPEIEGHGSPVGLLENSSGTAANATLELCAQEPGLAPSQSPSCSVPLVPATSRQKSPWK